MNHQVHEVSKPAQSTTRSIIRLFVGLVETWLYDLFHRMRTWEEQFSEIETGKQSPFGEAATLSAKPSDESPYAIVEVDWAENDEHANNVQPTNSLFRFAALGLMFDAQERIARSSFLLNRAIKVTGRLADLVFAPISNGGWFIPLNDRLKKLVERGEIEVNRWIDIGRSEEVHSRYLALRVQDDVVNSWITYLTANEEIVDLVETQSASLATEVVEELRERTVSADTFLEGVARSVFRRPPRSALPEPPPEIKQRAAPLHPKTIRSKKTGARS